MGWTPAVGASSLARRVGREEALRMLDDLTRGSARGEDLARPPIRQVLIDIGDGHAERLLVDETGARLGYWPRAWAARALSYIGDDRSRRSLVAALGDEHWRVRMNAVAALGPAGDR